MENSNPVDKPPRILVVDDEPGMLRYLQTLLEIESYRVETADSGAAAMERVRRDPVPDLVLLDLLMPQMDGMETLERLRQIEPGLRVILLTCANDARRAVQAIRLGAYDYLTKPFHFSELEAALRKCLSQRSAGSETTPFREKVEELSDDQLFVAASPAMQKVRAQAIQVASANVPILILGASGTGKEVVARLIHKYSDRAQRTFLKVNCAALPADLLESELFGYEAGAFTGANRPKPGKFELCNNGTILLDEIAEIPPALQAKLLHVLQDQKFSRLGSRSTIAVNVRILAATNVDIQKALAAKKFREDLYYRLNAFTFPLPPLRERKEEIPLLLKQFMALWADRLFRPPLPITEKLLKACYQYAWPGNVRELENFVKRYLILGDESLVTGELEAGGNLNGHHPTPPLIQAGAEPGDLKSLVRGLKGEAEMGAISRALEKTNWKRKEAARLLNISYKALLYKMREYGIDR